MKPTKSTGSTGSRDPQESKDLKDLKESTSPETPETASTVNIEPLTLFQKYLYGILWICFLSFFAYGIWLMKSYDNRKTEIVEFRKNEARTDAQKAALKIDEYLQKELAAGKKLEEISKDQIKEVVLGLNLGQKGYAFLMLHDGTFIVHPKDILVSLKKTVWEVGDQILPKEKMDELKTYTIGVSDPFIEYNNVITQQESWLFIEPIPSVKWGLGAIFIKDEIELDTQELKRILIKIVIILFLSLLFFLYIGFGIHRGNEKQLWFGSIATGIIFTLIISFIWQQAMVSTFYNDAESEQKLNKTHQEHDLDNNNNNKDIRALDKNILKEDVIYMIYSRLELKRFLTKFAENRAQEKKELMEHQKKQLEKLMGTSQQLPTQINIMTEPLESYKTIQKELLKTQIDTELLYNLLNNTIKTEIDTDNITRHSVYSATHELKHIVKDLDKINQELDESLIKIGAQPKPTAHTTSNNSSNNSSNNNIGTPSQLPTDTTTQTPAPLPKTPLALAANKKALAALLATIKKAQQVPIFTGIYIRSLEFSKNETVDVTGVVWQRYFKNFHDGIKREVTFPQAKNVRFFPAYEFDDGVSITIGSYFTIQLSQSFDYSRYPFDSKIVRIQIWATDMSKRVILAPDLQAYKLLSPTALPGIHKNLRVPGWKIERSYFGYIITNYVTNFGLYPSEMGEQVPTEGKVPIMYYSVEINRDMLNTLMLDLFPLILVMLILFIVIFMTGKGQLNMPAVLATLSSMFFTVILAHTRFKTTITTQEIVFFEYFYFILYIFILLVAIVTMPFIIKAQWRIINYKNLLIPQLMYWPLITSIILMLSLSYYY